MQHVTPFGILGGALRGTLPFPGLVMDEAGLQIASQCFAPRPRRSFDPRAGSNITLVADAMGIVLSSTGGAGTPGDDSATILPGQVYDARPTPLGLLAGGDLAGFLPNPTVRGENLLLAMRAYLPRPIPIPKVRAGTNVTIVEDALGSIVSSAGAAGPQGPVGGTAVLDLVESHDFAAAATSYSFAGLAGNTDERYVLIYKIIKNVAAALNVDVQPNGLTTNQATRGSYGGTSSGTFNPATMRIVFNGSLTAGDTIMGEAWLDAKTGNLRTGRANWTDTDGTSLFFLDAAHLWNETATAIVSLNILADTVNGIGAGSYVRLYKLKKVAAAAQVAEVQVALDGNLVFVATVTGLAWVTATSKIICSVFAVAAAGTTEEMAMASGVTVGAKNRVAGIGFDVWVYNPQGMSGTLTIHCIGG